MGAVRVESDGPVAIVTIDRPGVRNAVDAPTAAALADAFRAFDADESLAVAVLTGEGGTFCAGADLKAISSGRGNAVAGGLELAAWCDLRVAAEDAVFGVYCRRWGVPLCDGGTVRLVRLLGHSHALDLILTGRGVSGEEALRMGLANRLVAPGRALATAVELARSLAAFPQLCLRADRRSSYRQWELPLEEALRLETRDALEVIRSGETVSGATRFARGAGRHGSFGD